MASPRLPLSPISKPNPASCTASQLEHRPAELMKTRFPILALAGMTTLGSLSVALGQGGFVNPPQQPSQPQSGGGDTTIVNKQQQNNDTASPFGNEIPVFDASTENVMFNGNAWNVNDQRIFAMRFESYLNTPPLDDDVAREYYETLNEIARLLTTGGLTERRANMPKALALLSKASEYPSDNQISAALYNQIFQIWLVNRDRNQMKSEIASIKKEQDRLTWRGDLKATEAPLTNPTSASSGDNQRGGRNQGGGGNNATPAGVGTNSIEYLRILKDMGENDVAEKALTAAMKVSEVKAKTEYHLFMAQLFLQRRFQHCVLAGRFYNHIFDDGEATLKLKKNSDVGKLFNESLGGSPTVSTLDGMANESIGEVNTKIRAVKYLIEKNELWSAYQRLQEAFIIGEYLEPVRFLPLESKRRLHKFAQKRYRLLNAMAAKDFTRAGEYLEAMYDEAPDFDGAKEEAWVNSQMLASNMALKKAEQLYFENKGDEADRQIKTAIEIWPSNPNLQEFMEKSNDLTGVVKIRNDFERFKAEGNYELIVRDIGQYLAAFKDDEAKLDEINQIARDFNEVEQAIELSKRAESSSTPYAVIAAWEEVQILKDKFPTNMKLALRSDALTKQVAGFADTVQQAIRHERASRTGSALAHYMKARMEYPDSKYAREGIDRLLNEAMDDGSSSPVFDSGSDTNANTSRAEIQAPAKPSAPADPF